MTGLPTCTKCRQTTLELKNARFAEEQYCNNCGYFMVKYHQCCSNQFLEKVLYIQSDGRSVIREQCFSCGKLIRSAALAKNKVDLNKLKNFNERLHEEYIFDFNNVKSYYNGLIAANYSRLYSRYLAYLSTEEWFDIRNRILKRDGFKCRKCGNPATQVHHLTYEHLGHELDEDLISICRPCHLFIHEVSDKITDTNGLS